MQAKIFLRVIHLLCANNYKQKSSFPKILSRAVCINRKFFMPCFISSILNYPTGILCSLSNAFGSKVYFQLLFQLPLMGMILCLISTCKTHVLGHQPLLYTMFSRFSSKHKIWVINEQEKIIAI